MVQRLLQEYHDTIRIYTFIHIHAVIIPLILYQLTSFHRPSLKNWFDLPPTDINKFDKNNSLK
jgi:hypothetical protein